uniref:Secreted protein n=1 Tax=Panagrellus redivivus TaxID=6233 RepID=A0A7E4VMS3_PANRE
MAPANVCQRRHNVKEVVILVFNYQFIAFTCTTKCARSSSPMAASVSIPPTLKTRSLSPLHPSSSAKAIRLSCIARFMDTLSLRLNGSRMAKNLVCFS